MLLVRTVLDERVVQKHRIETTLKRLNKNRDALKKERSFFVLAR